MLEVGSDFTYGNLTGGLFELEAKHDKKWFSISLIITVKNQYI